MIPRRLLPYLSLFLVLAGSYYVLSWRQDRQEAEKTEAKKIFQVKEADISALVLKRGKEEMRLAKKDGAWFLTAPAAMRADQHAVDSMLATLAHLQKERDLGSHPDLKVYGLDKPALIVEFTAPGQKTRRLAIGNAAPGRTGYYAYQDQAPRDLLLINPGNKESLDRREKDLRDKTLFAFTPDQVKSLRLKTPDVKVAQLEKEGPKSWRWVGREKFPVRGDRVEQLVRTLHLSRVKDFVADSPKNLKTYGLAPPRGEIEVVQDKEPVKLLLGDQAKEGRYARKAPDGPVVVTGQDLLALVSKTLTTLEDRRLWRGEAAKVQKAVWGPPDKTWVGVKEKDFWKISGPEKQEAKQPAVLLEVGLWKLQALEFTTAAPPKTLPDKPLYLLELVDAAGQPLFRLEELAREKNREVLVRVKAGDKTDTGLVPAKAYQEFQREMTRLTNPPGGMKGAPEPKSKKE